MCRTSFYGNAVLLFALALKEFLEEVYLRSVGYLVEVEAVAHDHDRALVLLVRSPVGECLGVGISRFCEVYPVARHNL